MNFQAIELHAQKPDWVHLSWVGQTWGGGHSGACWWKKTSGGEVDFSELGADFGWGPRWGLLVENKSGGEVDFSDMT